MASTRRRGVESSATRADLIEAAEQLIREEGYAALTSRTLADRLSLSRQIVHYYFKSIDDLLIAVATRGAEKSLERLERALQSEKPLRAVWEVCSNPDNATLALEMKALANRRPAVQEVVQRHAEQFREVHTRAIARDLELRGITPRMKPVVASVLLTSLSQVLALESAVKIKKGHKETLDFVEDCLCAYEQGLESPLPNPPKRTKVATDQRKKKPAAKSATKRR